DKELPNEKHAEESYDTQQIHLTSLLEDLSPNNIVKIYKIQRPTSNEDSLSCPALFPMHQITRIRGNDVFGPEVRLEAGGESLCHLKRSLNDWFTEEQRLTQADNNNKENLDPEQLNGLRVALNKSKAKNLKINVGNVELLGIMHQHKARSFSLYFSGSKFHVEKEGPKDRIYVASSHLVRLCPLQYYLWIIEREGSEGKLRYNNKAKIKDKPEGPTGEDAESNEFVAFKENKEVCVISEKSMVKRSKIKLEKVSENGDE
ncbi:12612_t:CDS:2, partial [Gigaspora rosea]